MFSIIPSVTELCTSVTDYGKCPKSQHGIHKPEIRHYISFLDVGLHTFGSNVGTLNLAPFFIPPTSLCSLSSWLTSSYVYHLITVITFVLTICHSLDLSLQTYNSSLSQILSSIVVTLIPSGLTSRILTCTVLKGHWRCLF